MNPGPGVLHRTLVQIGDRRVARPAGGLVSVRGRPPRPEPAVPPPTPVRGLCVDDNPDAVFLLAALLSDVGFSVRLALDGRTGLAEGRAFRPHACVLDLQMPRMDGFEVAERLRAELGPDVLLVAVTGQHWDDLPRRTAEAGFDQVFRKPVEPESLVMTLLAAAERFPT